MRTLPLLLVALAAPALAAPGTSTAPASAPAGEVVTKAGAAVTADLRSEYLAGFPVLVEVRVRNGGSAPLSFPNLSARPHLVRFLVDGPKGRTERFTTPPATDSGKTWTIPPGSTQRVLLEVPSGDAFAPGDYTVTVRIADPAGEVELPTQPFTLRTPSPVAGRPLVEPSIARNSGAMFPWMHQAGKGYELYLASYDPKAPGQVVAQYHLAHVDQKAEPILARSRPGEASARHVYWQSAPNQLTVGQLAVTRFENPPRTYTLPYPSFTLLDRGVSDEQGRLVIPVWVPAPKGTGGNVYAWTITNRGEQVVRDVLRLDAPPAQVTVAADAASHPVIAIAHRTGIDLFRVDPTLPPEIPAYAKRAWKAEGGWAVSRLAFDVLPTSPTHPGGLSLLGVLTRSAEGVASHRAMWFDLNGSTVSDSGPRPWPFSGTIVDLLPAGYGPFYVLVQDAQGWAWGAQGGNAARLAKGGPGALWEAADSIKLRTLGGATVATDLTLGPKAQ